MTGRLRLLISRVILKVVKTERKLRGLVLLSYPFVIRRFIRFVQVTKFDC